LINKPAAPILDESVLMPISRNTGWAFTAWDNRKPQAFLDQETKTLRINSSERPAECPCLEKIQKLKSFANLLQKTFAVPQPMPLPPPGPGTDTGKGMGTSGDG
jgi:hypothetical protein